MRRITFLLSGLMIMLVTSAQSGPDKAFPETDSTISDTINFTRTSASQYIINLLEMNDLWRSDGDTMRLSLARLIDHSNEPFDSVENRLVSFQYDSVNYQHVDITEKDTIPLRWLNDSTFIIDTVSLVKEPYIIQQTVVKSILDSSARYFNDSIPERAFLIDSVLQVRDTIIKTYIDTSFLESRNVRLYRIEDGKFIPPLLPAGQRARISLLPDSGKLVISTSAPAIVAGEESPFNILPDELMPDSLRAAVETLLAYTDRRDSILLYFNDVYGRKTPFWLSSENDDLYRYWIKNYHNDSITVWIGNPEKNEVSLSLEEDIIVNRMKKEVADDIPITLVKPEWSLAEIEPLKEIPIYWDYDFSSSFILNQTYLSNWAKGGENSFSSLLDIEGTAEYTDKEKETQWTNSGRLKYGTIITEEYGLRTNTDMLELNSKYNKVLQKKIDFSSVFYLKTQVARGYNYPNDSVIVSKFLNPGTFTIGVGLEYKPFKKTSLNFSPLSYKNTFVLDTANIDQTAHGIAADKRAKQEMGGQLVLRNKISLMEDMNVSNSVRLFSGYLKKPFNIDVDWEINLDKKINWYFTILLNLHMIYDDDILFPVLDDNDEPVLLPNGDIKKEPRMQFKQFLGLTFSFQF